MGLLSPVAKFLMSLVSTLPMAHRRHGVGGSQCRYLLWTWPLVRWVTLAGTQAAILSGETSSSEHSSVPFLGFFFPSLPSEDRGDADPADHSGPPGWPGFGYTAPWARLHQVPQGRSSCQTEDVLRGWCHPWRRECVAGRARGQMDLVSHREWEGCWELGVPPQRGLGSMGGGGLFYGFLSQPRFS